MELTILMGVALYLLSMNIPIFIGKRVRCLSIPIGYRLYDKNRIKLQIASDLIKVAMPILKEYQVILLCNSWYPKGEIIETTKKYQNLDLICAVRHDTALYDLSHAPTGKGGRLKTHGEKLAVTDFSYEKVVEYFVLTRQALTNLFGTKTVTVTVSVENNRNIRIASCIFNHNSFRRNLYFKRT